MCFREATLGGGGAQASLLDQLVELIAGADFVIGVIGPATQRKIARVDQRHRGLANDDGLKNIAGHGHQSAVEADEPFSPDVRERHFKFL